MLFSSPGVSALASFEAKWVRSREYQDSVRSPVWKPETSAREIDRLFGDLYQRYPEWAGPAAK